MKEHSLSHQNDTDVHLANHTYGEISNQIKIKQLLQSPGIKTSKRK